MVSWVEKVGRNKFLAVFLIAGLAFAAYARFLGIGLTGRDLPELLWTSQGLSAAQIFSRGFLVTGTFYRPLATLSYVLNYKWFALDAFGYHLTDVLLHVAVAVLTYSFVRVSFARIGGYAMLAGVLVALHPAAIEVVPNISHRMDSVVTVFALLTLVLFVIALEGSGKEYSSTLIHPAYPGAVVCFLAAVLSKEIGFVTVLIAAAYALVKPTGYHLSRRIAKTLILVTPFLIVAALVMWWRAQILGSALGGVENNPFADPAAWTKDRASDLVTYLWFLLFPSAPTPSDYDTNQLSNFVLANWQRLLVVSVLTGTGTALAVNLFRSRVGRSGQLLLRYLVFLCVWIVLPFGVYALTLFRFRYIYFSIPPVAILLSVVSLRSIHYFQGTWNSVRSASANSCSRTVLPVLAGAGVVAALVVLGQLLYSSPLLQKYEGFGDSGKLATALLADFKQNSTGLRSAKQITVENLPHPQWQTNGSDPESRELGNLWLPAYYRLVTGDTASNWCVKSIVRTSTFFVPFRMDMNRNDEYEIRFGDSGQGEKIEYAGCCQEFSCK